MTEETRRYLAEIGQRGGRKSRRRLDPAVAREMVRLREAGRAYRKYQALCFWSYDPSMRIGPTDVPWIAQQLRKYGNRETWDLAARLCR